MKRIKIDVNRSLAVCVLFLMCGRITLQAAIFQYLDAPNVFAPSSFDDLSGYINFDEIDYSSAPPFGDVNGTNGDQLTITQQNVGSLSPTAGTITDLGASTNDGFLYTSHPAFSGSTTAPHSAIRVLNTDGVSLDLGGDMIYVGFYVAAESGTEIELYNDGVLQTTFSSPTGLSDDYKVDTFGNPSSQIYYYVHFLLDESTRFDEIQFHSGNLEIDNIAFSNQAPDFISSFSTTPEPSTFALLVMGAGLLFNSRKKYIKA